jgi:hypothetical protein
VGFASVNDIGTSTSFGYICNTNAIQQNKKCLIINKLPGVFAV